MSRTIPAVTDDCLVTVGPRCHVVCLNPASGDFKWGLSMTAELGATEPLWYTGQCPLIDGNKVILAPGGPDALLAAVDAATGKIAWKTPNPQGWKMSHSSVMPMTLAGTRMYVYAAVGGVAGVSPEDGKLLWSVPWNAEVVAASPVALDGDRVFVTGAYGAGGLMIRVTAKDGAFAAEVLDKHLSKDGFACEQQTPIFRDGLLYGIMPKDAGALRGQFVCYKPDGALVWSSGPTNRFGLGPFILADGKFCVLSDDGTLTVLEASPEKYSELSRAKVLDGQDAWGPIAIAGTRMIVRDSKKRVCVDIAGGAA
jgi:outer membrane protein assembly factor BamB